MASEILSPTSLMVIDAVASQKCGGPPRTPYASNLCRPRPMTRLTTLERATAIAQSLSPVTCVCLGIERGGNAIGDRLSPSLASSSLLHGALLSASRGQPFRSHIGDLCGDFARDRARPGSVPVSTTLPIARRCGHGSLPRCKALSFTVRIDGHHACACQPLLAAHPTLPVPCARCCQVAIICYRRQLSRRHGSSSRDILASVVRRARMMCHRCTV